MISNIDSNSVLVTIKRAICPHCHQDSKVSLEGRFDGSVAKDDSMYGSTCLQCHRSFKVEWTHATQTLKIKAIVERRGALPCFILMGVTTNENKILYFAFKEDSYGDPDKLYEPEEFDNKRYFYEEHTCPTNFIRYASALHYDGDDDPHDVMKFYGIIKVEDAVYQEDNIEQGIDIVASWPHLFRSDVIDMESTSVRQIR